MLNIEGPSNEQVFTIECSIPEVEEVVTAQGSSRRAAEQQAASQMLTLLGLDEDNL